jgi:hypothetical protein
MRNLKTYKMMWIVILAFTFQQLFHSCNNPGSGVNYYIDSESGNDNNKGTSPKSPWKSVDRVNTVPYNPGDHILFRANSYFTGHLWPKGKGDQETPIIVDKYGEGEKPIINAGGFYNEALLLFNTECWEINNLELVNKGKGNPPFRTGVRIRIDNFGIARHIYLKNLIVRDVNGTSYKSARGPDIINEQYQVVDKLGFDRNSWCRGAGIGIDNMGDSIRSRYEDLLIEGCRLARTDRDGIVMYSSYLNYPGKWFPNKKVIIRNNLLEDFGGDGILVMGCDSAVIEKNVLSYGRMRCPDYAAGIWPYASHNTIIQFNEVSHMHGVLDGMAYDSDGGCRNTIFQYNYSHDNDGGFLMVCGGNSNKGTIVRYNISQNDRHRVIYLTGAVEDVEFYNNVIYLGEGLDEYAFWPGGGKNPGDFAVNFTFANNILYFKGKGRYNLGGITTKNIINNYFYGNHVDLPKIPGNYYNDPGLKNPGTGGNGLGSLDGYRLITGSLAIKAGLVYKNMGTMDFEGNKVPSGGKANIGAFEKQNN